MGLFSSGTSPFARKVRIVAAEHGFLDRIEIIACNPFRDCVPPLRSYNPLGKIPALVLDDGTTLFDSRVICEYLDSLAPSTKLLPADAPRRWMTLRRVALADGVMDAAFSLVVEGRRPTGKRSPVWATRWRRAISEALAQVEASPPDAFDMGAIGLVCALGYLDFRFPDLAWRTQAPLLDAWAAALASRPSVAATVPVGG